MAIGDASVTKGYVSELQSSTKLHESSFEPEPTNKGKKPDTQDEPQGDVLFARKLEEALDSSSVGFRDDWAVYVEIHGLQAKKCLSCHGLLSSRGQRCC